MDEEKDLKTIVLNELRKKGGYLSGQELADLAGVSRTAVWKAVNALTEDGCRIDAVRNRGYLLVSEPDILSAAYAGDLLPASFSAGTVEFYDAVDSTNNRLRQLGEEGAAEGSLAAAEVQTAGKGRRGRTWVSGPGTALTFSVLLRPDVPPEKAPMLTLCAALAVYRAVSSLTGLPLGIKWPNDIVCRGKKLCGILTEMSADMDRVHYVIVGIGLNVSAEDFPEELADKACSIRSEGGKSIPRLRLLKGILEELESVYRKFLADGSLKGLRGEYEAALANLGQQVSVLEPQGDWQGLCRGITDEVLSSIHFPYRLLVD